jgi:hypothetical protein
MSYASNNYFKHGSWNIICDVCGVRYKSDEVRKRWDGLIVCQNDWEADHPQKYLRVQSDPKQVPFIRHEPQDTFVEICFLDTKSGYAGLAAAGCAQAGNVSVPYSVLRNNHQL